MWLKKSMKMQARKWETTLANDTAQPGDKAGKGSPGTATTKAPLQSFAGRHVTAALFHHHWVWQTIDKWTVDDCVTPQLSGPATVSHREKELTGEQRAARMLFHDAVRRHQADPVPRYQGPTTEKTLFTQQVSSWLRVLFSSLIPWNDTTFVCRETCFPDVRNISTYILEIRKPTLKKKEKTN